MSRKEWLKAVDAYQDAVEAYGIAVRLHFDGGLAEWEWPAAQAAYIAARDAFDSARGQL